MKQIYFIPILFFPVLIQAQNSDTLLYERFETGGASFTLNSADQGGTSAAVGYNQWIINNSYTGGSGQLICSGLPTTFTVPDTPLQPAGTTGGPSTYYMHMMSDAGQAAGILNCSYLAANGLCGGNESNFSRMSQDVNTTGYDSVNVSFIWLCDGSQNIYGELYYSTDSGTSWTLVTTPSAQYSGQATWATRNVSIPLFAGQTALRIGFRFVNNISFNANDPGFAIDEFLITASVSAPAPVAAFTVSDSAICEGTCVDFTDMTSNSPTSWFWIFPGSSTSFSTQQYPTGICYNTPGTYDVTLIVENASGSDTLTVSTITVFANPSAPLITASADTLFATPGFASYEWSLDGVLISGAISDTLFTVSNGYYTVSVTDSNGCTAVSTAFLVNTGIEEHATSDLQVYPNPVAEKINFRTDMHPVKVTVHDFTGRKILELSEGLNGQRFIDVSSLTGGWYCVRFVFDNGIEIVQRFSKVKPVR
jgi:PKD repeat protein